MAKSNRKWEKESVQQHERDHFFWPLNPPTPPIPPARTGASRQWQAFPMTEIPMPSSNNEDKPKLLLFWGPTNTQNIISFTECCLWLKSLMSFYKAGKFIFCNYLAEQSRRVLAGYGHRRLGSNKVRICWHDIKNTFNHHHPQSRHEAVLQNTHLPIL